LVLWLSDSDKAIKAAIKTNILGVKSYYLSV